MESKDKVVEKAKKDLPNFFHPGRMDDILAVFEVLDANEEFGVDVRLSMFLSCIVSVLDTYAN